MSSFSPTLEQKEILRHKPDSHARVLAGPGTGKSATLVALIDALRGGEAPPRLKLLTFTRAATGELAKKVAEHPIAAAERPSTIHSFAISVLLRNPGVGGFPEPLRIADDWETRQIVHPTLARRIGVQSRRINNLFLELAANWEALEPRQHPKVDPKDRARFLGGWQEHREIYGYTLLAELPYALKNALQDHPDLEGVDYDLLIVDEYQDLNACDLEALHLIAERGCAIIAAGDDDQSIYSFRRAAPEGIRRFPTDYCGCGDYSLTITHRCGSRIIDWASFVIEGDPSRPLKKPRLRSAESSPPGEVAFLAFAGAKAEAQGVGQLIHRLVEREGIPPPEILVLLRGDYQGAFSRPMKEALQKLSIPYSDPDAVNQMLAETDNRRMLATLRLLVHRTDSLAWATLLKLRTGVGDSFGDCIYERARSSRQQFGQALLEAYEEGFPDAPTASSRRAKDLIGDVLSWVDARRPLPDHEENDGWGQWILSTAGDDVVPGPSESLTELLLALDELVEPEIELGRYLGQIGPVGKDLAQTESQGVRIMSMAASKGLTVQAAILAGLEEGILPRPDADLSEERRLLYVAMTRAKKFLFCTWARRRQGPTARAGQGRVIQRRTPSPFLRGGPMNSEDGGTYITKRWD